MIQLEHRKQKSVLIKLKIQSCPEGNSHKIIKTLQFSSLRLKI
jgi:hypothetical protein